MDLILEIQNELNRAISEIPFSVGAIWLECNADTGEVIFCYNTDFDFEIDSWPIRYRGFQSKSWKYDFWNQLNDFCVAQISILNHADRVEYFMGEVIKALSTYTNSNHQNEFEKPIIVMCIEHDDSPRQALRRFTKYSTTKFIEFATIR